MNTQVVVAAFLMAAAPATIRAATPSMVPGMPPEVESWRTEILQQEQYADLATQWQAYLDENPRSAVAMVQLARAQRYGKLADATAREELARKALAMDSSCVEALVAVADIALHGETGKKGDPLARRSKELADKAVELAPEWAIPHFTLWPLCMALGLEDEAKKNLAAIALKGGVEPPTLDFGYNLLVSADPGAIIITNGDNDTYPPLALQEAYGIRPDVRVVNLSLLNIEKYAKEVWQSRSGESRAFSASEIDEIIESWNDDLESGTTTPILAQRVVSKLMEKVRTGAHDGPVYFACTVYHGSLASAGQALELEGLLMRVKQEESQDPLEDCSINADKSIRLLRAEFRMDSATDFGMDWKEGSAARMLMMNYPSVYGKVAAAAADKGDTGAVRHALGEAIRLYRFHQMEDRAKDFEDYRNELLSESR